MAAEKIPPEAQQYIMRLQQLQEQLNVVLTEKSVVENELREVERVLSTLKDMPPDAVIFKAAGRAFLVKVSKEDAEKELNERKEILELRLKTLQKQESLLRKQAEELQKKVNEILAKTYQSLAGTLEKSAG